MVKTIMALQKYDFFNELEFRIIGDGPLFDEILAPISQLENVIIERRFINRYEIKSLHQQYGIFMCPTRMDTQGVSRDEAMSSGLVPLTNYVAAIPEFVDDSCAVIAEPEDVEKFVEGIINLYHEPNKFSLMSEAARSMVKHKSCSKDIIQKELQTFTHLI